MQARTEGNAATSGQYLIVRPSYSFRPRLFASNHNFFIERNAIVWSSGRRGQRIPFSDIGEVRLIRRFMRGDAALNKKAMWLMELYCRAENKLVLSPIHCVRFGVWEDRSSAYFLFVNQLLARLVNTNPKLKIITVEHWAVRLRQHVRRRAARRAGNLLSTLIRGVRHFDPDWTIDLSARAMRAIGPWLRGHRVARANLTAAFPEKSADEIDQILDAVWGNFGRTMAEYAFLERLWDFDLGAAGAGRITIAPDVRARIDRVRASEKNVLCFGAHLANWELPAVAAAALGFKFAVLYRPPGLGALADDVIAVRQRLMGKLIPAGRGAAVRIKSALRDGLSVGMLVDQHFVGGVKVDFFGRRASTNPTLARFARLRGCAIHGMRTVRLPDNRFRLELTDPISLPRDSDGKVSVEATTQVITAVIESWVREHPEQWLWMHRRWR
jgi:KDO2-lipid IV(A) lauroyltransferase